MSEHKFPSETHAVDTNTPGSEGGTPGFVEETDEVFEIETSATSNTPGSEGGTAG
jgi:hypothetical protein